MPKKTYRRGDFPVHDDWYDDGTEGEDEQLWRLDFSVGENSFQVQLFARVAEEDLPDDPADDQGDDLENERYTEFRLLLERDNRTAVGRPGREDAVRTDYASHGFKLTPARAMTLLSLPSATVLSSLGREIAHAAALPCDRAMLDDPAAYADPAMRAAVAAAVATGQPQVVEYTPPPSPLDPEPGAPPEPKQILRLAVPMSRLLRVESAGAGDLMYVYIEAGDVPTGEFAHCMFHEAADVDSFLGGRYGNSGSLRALRRSSFRLEFVPYR